MIIALIAIIQTGSTNARNVPTEDNHAGLTDQKNFINFGGGNPSSGGLPGSGTGIFSGFGGLPSLGGDHGGDSGSGIFSGFGGSGGSNNGDFFGSFPHP